MRLLPLFALFLLLPGLTSAEEVKPKRLLLVAQGPDGHPPGTHEYAGGQLLLAQALPKFPVWR